MNNVTEQFINDQTQKVMQHLQPMIKDILEDICSRNGNEARGKLTVGLVKGKDGVYVLPAHLAKPVERFFEEDAALKYGKAIIDRINELPEEFHLKYGGKYTVFVDEAVSLDSEEYGDNRIKDAYYIGVGVTPPKSTIPNPGGVLLTQVENGSEMTVSDFIAMDSDS